MGRHLELASALIALALAIGVLGYRAAERMDWIGAF
jgi:hypothetical protein